MRYDSEEATRRAPAARPAAPACTARAVTCARADFPVVNSSWEDGAIRVFEHVNLGIAVDVNHEGLFVPVIRRAHDLGVEELLEGVGERATP